MASGFQPNGEDRATGIGGLPGTATPAGAIKQSPGGAGAVVFEELATSPTLEAGDQGTIVHEFRTDSATGISIANAVPRGTILVDSNGLISKVLSTSFQQQPGNMGLVRMTAEDLAVAPPDEFRVEAVEFNPSIFRHPKYQSVVNYTGGPLVGSQIIAIIQGATNLPQISAQAEAQNFLTSTQISNPSVLALAQEMFGLIQNGNDTFYLAGFKVTWSQYSYAPILMNPGGYIEDPVTQGGLPAYFWSTTQAPGGSNIFTTLANEVAPALYAGGISWLRQSDDLEYQRTWFRITRIWLGGVLGHWSPLLYNSH